MRKEQKWKNQNIVQQIGGNAPNFQRHALRPDLNCNSLSCAAKVTRNSHISTFSNKKKGKRIFPKTISRKIRNYPPNLAQYENGKRIPKIETLDKIASALDVFIADINENITWDERKNTSEAERINKEIAAIDGFISILVEISGSDLLLNNPSPF